MRELNKMEPYIIDAHAHCGIQDRFSSQAFEDYLNDISGSDIQGTVFFAPVIEIYDRFDPNFKDDTQWQQRRKNANDYLLGLDSPRFRVIPYFFIWNDFAVNELTSQHKGIKWHRHALEPKYHYDDPLCRIAIEEIRKRNMPVVLEEEFENTIYFLDEIASGITVIIPHMGFLNGGYSRIDAQGLWSYENVYADTSLASREEILHYINKYGSDKLLFGSDFPFGSPKDELKKIMRLPIAENNIEAIIGGNLKRLLAKSNLKFKLL
jgi:uncharacterized protein